MYVIADDQQKRLYQALVRKQKNKDIYVFSFEDEVLTLLEEGYTASPTLTDTPNGRMSFLCGGGISSSQGTDIGATFQSTCTGNWAPGTINTSSFRVRTEYDKFGVYFRLRIQLLSSITPVDPSGSHSNCLRQGTFQANMYIRTNCGPDHTWPSNPNGTHTYDLQLLYSSGWTTNSFLVGQTWTPYDGTRGVRCFRIINFRLLNQNHIWNETGANQAACM